MTLQKQLVPIVVPQGVNTKINEALLPMQQAAKLDNYRLDKQGEIRKRYGFDPITPLPKTIRPEFGANFAYEARGVFDFNGNVFIVGKYTDYNFSDVDIANNKDTDLYRVFQYNSLNNSYLDRGVTGNFTHTLQELTYSDTEEVMPSWAIVGNSIVCAFIRYNSSNVSTGLLGGFVNVYDLSTYTLLTSLSLGSTVWGVKVCQRDNNSVYILTNPAGSTNLLGYTLDVSLLTLSSSSTVATNLSATQPNFDLKFHALTQKALVFYNTGASAILGYLSATATLEPSPTPLVFTGQNGDGAIHLNTIDTQEARGNIQLAWASGASPFPCYNAFTSWNWTALPTVRSQNQASLVRQITTDQSFVYCGLLATLVNSQPINNSVAVWSSSVGPWTLWDQVRSVGLASEALHFQGVVALAHESKLQPTTFLYHGASKRILAKMAQSKSGGLAGAIGPVGTSSYTLYPSCLPALILHTLNDSGSSPFYELLTVTKSGTVSEGGELFGTRNIAAIRLTKAGSPQAVQSSSLFLAGSQVEQWDGVTLASPGFYLSPENVVAVTDTGATTTAGVYGWAVTYSWEDATGKRWESFAAQGTITLTASQQIKLTIPTLRLTAKSNVVINTYRTTVNGTLLQRCDAGNATSATIIYTPSSPRFNDKTVDSVNLWLNIPVSASDTEIETRAILYTSGGELDNDPPPSCSHLALYRGRMVYTGLEDKRYIGYSKLFTPETPPNFSNSFVLGIPDDGETVTASQQLDDKLIIFKPTGIYALAGSGPLNTGLQDDFDTPVLVATDVGCASPQSIVLYSEGVLFKSLKGIYELSRSMQVAYTGAPVEDDNSLLVTGGVLIDNKNEVRFTTTEKTLVYNYFFKQWMTHSGLPSLTSILVKGVHTICLTDGRIVQETTGYLDGGSVIRSTLETGWLTTAIQGYQRIYRFLFLGQSLSNTQLNVSLAYDYNKFTSESFLVTTSTMYPVCPLGESGYGVGLFGGPYFGVTQFMVMPSTQKCQSVKIRLEDTPLEEGEGLILSAITALVGAKAGTQKLAAQYRALKN